jgi:Domain of unknown function (DUF4126)
MHLLFDIFQGIGIAAAVGIRPFLPALVAGALAAGNVEIHFDHTKLSFLQSPPFLLALVVLVIVLAFLERRFGHDWLETGPASYVLAAFAFALGALLFAGSLARGHYATWPGVIGGIACALVGLLATRPLFARVRSRLDREAVAAVPLYAEALGVALAALSIIAPPVGPIGLLALLWLLFAGRRRAGQKYAGLRILR